MPKTAQVKDFESSAASMSKNEIDGGKLNKSFSELSVVDEQPAKAGVKSAASTKFLYEPALFPNRLVKKITNGKDWHDLSPTTKQRVN